MKHCFCISFSILSGLAVFLVTGCGVPKTQIVFKNKTNTIVQVARADKYPKSFGKKMSVSPGGAVRLSSEGSGIVVFKENRQLWYDMYVAPMRIVIPLTMKSLPDGQTHAVTVHIREATHSLENDEEVHVPAIPLLARDSRGTTRSFFVSPFGYPSKPTVVPANREDFLNHVKAQYLTNIRRHLALFEQQLEGLSPPVEIFSTPDFPVFGYDNAVLLIGTCE